MEYCRVTESEDRDNPQISSNDAKQKHKQKKHRKTNKEVNKFSGPDGLYCTPALVECSLAQ